MAKTRSGTISRRMARRAKERRKKRLIQLSLVTLGVVILAGLIWAVIRGNTTNSETQSVQASVLQALPEEISVTDAYQFYEEGAFLLDVRTQEEWDEYHIPGTALIPLDELESRLNEVPSDQDVVVVCRSGNRSQVGRDVLLQGGLTRVTSMDGGVSDWRLAGYPIE
jgi:rhodanese-related sulfurtransferase